MKDQQKDRILIVDDDLAMLKLLRRSLGDRYNVLVAPLGYDIETLIHHHEPDLLILDIGLPEESGRDLCRNLRQRRDFDGMAILLLSGLQESEVAAAAIQAGADGYLTKPFDLPVLLSAIAHIIESKKASLQPVTA